MFTNYQDIMEVLKQEGLTPGDIAYIPRGVMTDKYSFSHNGRRYIIRCFQPHRHNQPEIEYRYLSLFQELNIKAPKPYTFSHSAALPFLIYEMIDGTPLADCFDSLNLEKQKALCQEIVNNYRKLSEIQSNGYGRIQDFDRFSDDSWSSFIKRVIESARTIAEKQSNYALAHCCDWMSDFSEGLTEPQPNLIWSDFSSDNIIVDESGNLSGFIDFEGLLSGDSKLGIGYMLAHETNNNLTTKLMDSFGIPKNSDEISFYSLIRWCRLMPYQHLPLLNGEEREPLRDFLPNAYRLIKSFEKE